MSQERFTLCYRFDTTYTPVVLKHVAFEKHRESDDPCKGNGDKS